MRGSPIRAIAWIFVAPTILLLLAINIFPLIWTIYLSFTNFRVNRPNNDVEWVGLRNYERILTDPTCLDHDAGHRAFPDLDHRPARS
jgi:multiple sugar transport system permease protein